MAFSERIVEDKALARHEVLGQDLSHESLENSYSKFVRNDARVGMEDMLV